MHATTYDTMSPYLHYRIHDKAIIVDIDGSYLNNYLQKVQRLERSGMPTTTLNLPSSPPISGWEMISETNTTETIKLIL